MARYEGNENENGRIRADVRSTRLATPLLPYDNLAAISRRMIAMTKIIPIVV